MNIRYKKMLAMLTLVVQGFGGFVGASGPEPIASANDTETVNTTKPM